MSEPSAEFAMGVPDPLDVQPASRVPIVRVALLAGGIIAAILLGRAVGGKVPEFAQWVASLGAWGPIAFITGYIVACIAFIPGVVLTLAGGAIFGWLGVVYVLAGAVLGATAAFLIARYLARGVVERRLGRNPRFAAIDRAIGREGRKIVTLLRLSPVFPFNLLNYALGLTHVSLSDYLRAMIGIVPGTLVYVYAGKVLGDVAALAGGAAPPRGLGYYAVLGLGLAATVAVTAVVTRTARRALAELTDADHPGGPMTA
jgi:uncharacterized membrane protein YdjX (TVP38/TMEM64 family)